MQTFYVADFYDIRTAKGVEEPNARQTQRVVQDLFMIHKNMTDPYAYSTEQRDSDALAAWTLCNYYMPEVWRYAPSNIYTPEALRETWSANIRRCLYYIAATAVPPKKHGSPTGKTIRVHPTVVDMLTNSNILLRVDPVEDGKPNSFSCNIKLGAPVIQTEYYRKLIPFYVQRNNTGIDYLMTNQITGEKVDHIKDTSIRQAWKTAVEEVQSELASGARRGVIVRFISDHHMIAVLLLRYHAYIFDHNATNADSAGTIYRNWYETLQAFLTKSSPAGPSSTSTPIPDRLHGIKIQSFDEMVIGDQIWKIGVAYNIGPQPGNGDCQRATSNVISRLLTTKRDVEPQDYYVSKKIQLVWSWVLLDAIANAYPKVRYAVVMHIYARLIALYEWTRHRYLPPRPYIPIPGSGDNLVVTLSGDKFHTYDVWRWDDDDSIWRKVKYSEYVRDHYQYSLYIYEKSQTIYYRLIPRKTGTFDLGERGVADYSAVDASAAGSAHTDVDQLKF